MVVANGRIALAVVVLLGPQACAATDVPPAAPDQATSSARSGASPVAPAVTGPPSPPTVRIDTVSGASTSQAGAGAYRYRAQIPQLVGLEPHGEALDSRIRGTIQRDIDTFTTAAQDAQTPTDLTCTNRTVRVTAGLAVFRVDCTSSQVGADHPSTVTHTFNCDLAGTRILTLQDLFSAGSAYLDVLSTAARSQFPPQATPAADRTVADGTAPVAANFRTFLLDRASLVILFPGFQVAPGQAAEPEVSISYDDLRRYFAPGISKLLTG